MSSSARQQLIDLAKALDIAYLLAPAQPTDPLINLGTFPGIPSAELKSGATLTASGLLSGVASVVLDGIDDYVDLNWDPESISEKVTFFGLSNLINGSGSSQVVAWFSKFEAGIQNLETRIIKGASLAQGTMLPFGVALRILTADEVEQLFSVLSEISSTSWRNLGVVVDSTLTGVIPEIPRTGVLSP